MDSAKLMIETLRQIGYPNVDNLDPNAVEWVFENVATKPFLDWFCHNLSADNVVTANDMQEFADLEAKGVTLTEAQLKDNLQPLEELHLDEDHLRSDIEELEKSLKKLKMRKETLLKRNNDLSAHHQEKKNKVMKLRGVEDRWSKISKQNIEKSTAINAKIDESVQQLSQSIHTLADFYRPTTSDNQPRRDGRSHMKDADFLSQGELKAFHDAEEKFSKDLTAFTKKQFFNGMAEVPGDKEGSSYSLLDVSSSEGLPAGGGEEEVDETEEAFLKDCREFSRIKEIFPQSEASCINALINMKKAASAVHQAQAVLNMLRGRQFPEEAKDLRIREQGAEQTLMSAQAEAAPLLSAMPDLIRELGSLQGTNVLTGDYDLKLRRQDYFVHNQNRVIKHLVTQRARNEFLSLMYEVEIRWHKDTHRLVMAARQRLEEHLDAWHTRMSELESSEYSCTRQESSVVDVRDLSTERLTHMMEDFGSGDKPLVLQTGRVTSQAAALSSTLEGVRMEREETDRRDEHTRSQLELCSSDCHNVLYAGSTTSRGLPALTTPDLQLALTSLNSDLIHLEKSIKLIVDNFNTKQTTLKNNPLLNKERDLYVLFHNNPARLQQVVTMVQERSRVQAMGDS